MKYDESVCKFNMDTGCVELLLRDGRMISIFIIQKFFYRAIQQNTRIVALLTQLNDVRTTRIFTDSRIQATKDFPIFSWLDAVEHAALL